MTAPREVENRKVAKMLEDCAPESTTRSKKRCRVTKFNGKAHHYPKGARTLEVGHVIKLVSQLGIDPSCAKRHFPALAFRMAS